MLLFSFNIKKNQMNFGHHDESKRLLEVSMLSRTRFPVILGQAWPKLQPIVTSLRSTWNKKKYV